MQCLAAWRGHVNFDGMSDTVGMCDLHALESGIEENHVECII